MKGSDNAKIVLQKVVDGCFAVMPRPLPDRDRLEKCRIISHRGEHDNHRVFENSLEAFDRVRDQGVWGIELDIRWTKDLHPVVFHDRDLKRLVHDRSRIDDLPWSVLKERYPFVPSLETVIARYGKSMHLMVEIKEEMGPDREKQNRILNDLFSPLEPQIDFHFLSLNPAIFRQLEGVSAGTCLPVSELNVRRISDIVLEENYGGITGHYLLLTARYLSKHRQNGQKVGTGFTRSRNGLYRELNRGIEWIFTNHAVKLQSILNAARGLRN
ncbi:MAG: glycerophosphodiester phosphodiesterase [Desulfobacterales bacterium]